MGRAGRAVETWHGLEVPGWSVAECGCPVCSCVGVAPWVQAGSPARVGSEVHFRAEELYKCRKWPALRLVPALRFRDIRPGCHLLSWAKPVSLWSLVSQGLWWELWGLLRDALEGVVSNLLLDAVPSLPLERGQALGLGKSLGWPVVLWPSPVSIPPALLSARQQNLERWVGG